MSNISKCVAETAIQTKINLSTTSKTAEDIVSLSVSVDAITADRNVVVETINDLPDLGVTKLGDGFIVFVNSIKTHAVSSRERWVSLDGRLIRNDSNDYSLWGWGYRTQVGNENTANQLSPTRVGTFTNWSQINPGNAIITGLTSNGVLWAWGNTIGTGAGDGTTTARSSPVSVIGGFTDWIQTSSGDFHAVALRQNGTLWSWGDNNWGRLGDGTTFDRTSPAIVAGGFTDWCFVAAGRSFSAALRSNGTMWTWGQNTRGQLGTGNTTSQSSPVSVIGGFTDWKNLANGGYHIVASRSNGSLWTWGCNNFGTLGNNTSTDTSSPVTVVGGFTDWNLVTSGSRHSMANRSNGSLWAWGGNFTLMPSGVGSTGTGIAQVTSSPVIVIGGFTDWCQISAGSYHSAALRANGSIWTWGRNNFGQLGDGTTTYRSSPVSVIGGFTDWCQVGAGAVVTHGIRITF